MILWTFRYDHKIVKAVLVIGWLYHGHFMTHFWRRFHLTSQRSNLGQKFVKSWSRSMSRSFIVQSWSIDIHLLHHGIALIVLFKGYLTKILDLLMIVVLPLSRIFIDQKRREIMDLLVFDCPSICPSVHLSDNYVSMGRFFILLINYGRQVDY